MVNIIDLGLIYDVRYKPSEEKIEIDMTLTSPGCPMGDVIMEDAKQMVETNFKNFSVEIILVWEPAWTMERLTEAGKTALGKI
jgi:metal-sulfur cluster biosynthetic enzyme